MVMKGVITGTPNLKLTCAKTYENSHHRIKLAGAVTAMKELLSAPAAAAFTSRTVGVRPPSAADLRAAWQLSSSLNAQMYQARLHAFAGAEEVRANTALNIFEWYQGYESAIYGLFESLSHVIPFLVKVPRDTNVLNQHARDIINRLSYTKAVPTLTGSFFPCAPVLLCH